MRPARCSIERCYLEAASENILVGGDAMKIPDCRPTQITVRTCVFCKPLAWQGDAAIPVKNLLELKDGEDVLIEDCDFAQCWKSAQDGYCFMFTPSNGGSVSVVVRDCRVRDVGGIVNITGVDTTGANQRRTRVAIDGGEYCTNKATMGGSGRFSLITGGPERVTVERAFIQHEGASFIDVGDSAPIDVLRIVGSTWNYGSYGLRIGGYNHGDNTLGQIGKLNDHRQHDHRRAFAIPLALPRQRVRGEHEPRARSRRRRARRRACPRRRRRSAARAGLGARVPAVGSEHG